MGITASTLIIQCAPETISQIITAVEPLKKGEPTKKYHEILGVEGVVYFTTTATHLIYVGYDLMQLLAFNEEHPITMMLKWVPNIKAIYFFEETVGMSHLLYVNSDRQVIRKKLIVNGSYPTLEDGDVDEGELLPEEITAYGDLSARQENSDYMYGVSDLPIAIKFTERFLDFPNLENQLEELEFKQY